MRMRDGSRRVEEATAARPAPDLVQRAFTAEGPNRLLYSIRPES